ncbi:hypothetical protein [Sphingomicrobium sediminis]|uniref:Uncharacterized protein n=1 Tax=Sphingomicrobium sediminis TaxID=2950949 RepID=A0A9X2EH99_9SPHN|nr:hypothetical protein [Sphingomicrobium sediminis]MCM8556651.1 hypothetical protein [Sphingomicrobium sediminis]
MKSLWFQILVLIACFAFGVWIAMTSYAGLEGSSALWRIVGPLFAGFIATGLAAKLLQFAGIYKPEWMDTALDDFDEQTRRMEEQARQQDKEETG